MRADAYRDSWAAFTKPAFYGSDDEFRTLIVPFVEEALAAGEPVIIGYDERKAGLLRSWLPDPSAVNFLGDKSLYASPAGTIASYRKMFDGYLTEGARRIRIAGDVPHPGNGGRFDGWDRYESAMNTVWDDLPVWALCLYDTATAPAGVLEVVEQTHPRIALPGGSRLAGPRLPGPVRLPRAAGSARPARADRARGRTPGPVRGGGQARAQQGRPGPGGRRDSPGLPDRRLRGRKQRAALRPAAGDGPDLGRPEAASWSAFMTGATARPTTWPGSVPTPHRGTGQGMGLGLWVVHQLDLHVALCYGDDGFTLRLSGGEAVR